MNKPEIILVGGGGHCKSCIDVIELEDKYQIKGIIDLPKELGNEILGYKVFGNDNDLSRLAKNGYHFLITLGHMGRMERRLELFEIIKSNGGILPTICSPMAYISNHSKIGNGSIIMHRAVVNANTVIGENCIINSKALIEHDVKVGNNCHISTDVNINGGCIVYDDCFVGSGAILKNNIEIECKSFINMGSIITRSIE